MNDILLQQIGNNSIRELLGAIGIFVGIILAIWLTKKILIEKLQETFKKTKTKLDDKLIGHLDHIGPFTYTVIALYFALQTLAFPDTVRKVIDVLLLIIIVYEVVRVIQRLAMFFVEKKLMKGADKQGEHVVGLLKPIINITIWVVAILMVLSNLGINITSLVASLGIGGLAIALAVQNILSDLFNSFAIYLDKPFQVGDFIIVGDHMGTVKKIGLKSTRIQALGGEELVISNQELTSARVQNFKKMTTRRVVFAFGLTYDTPTSKLRKADKIVKETISAIKDVRFDRAHFKSFGDSSLDFEVVYYVNTGDYAKYMDFQQKINLAILDAFTKEGIEMAFPTRTVHMINASV